MDEAAAPAIKLIFVDDEPDIRTIVEMALKLDPIFDVRTFSAGPIALTYLGAGNWEPDLFLLDMQMPGMSGLELMAELRRKPALALKPVLFFTANARSEDTDNCYLAGAVDVIPKTELLQLAPRLKQAMETTQ